MSRFRSPSLFWTFAGAFLTVLLLGTALQALIIATIVDPLRHNWARDRMELVGRKAAAALADLGDEAPEGEIANVLHALESEVPEGRAVIVYRGWGRRAVPSRAAPRVLLGELMRQLGPPPEGAFVPRGPGFGEGPRGAGFGGRPPRDLGAGPPPDRGPDGPDGPPDGPPMGGPPEGRDRRPPDGGPDGDRMGGPSMEGRPGEDRVGSPMNAGPAAGAPRVRLAFRDSVAMGTRPGEVAVFELAGAPSLAGATGGGGLWLYFPLAMVLAGIAGLVMFRGQVRRLRALEGLATRVAAGDLAVRVGDSSPDEIGRLARQLDRMTEAMADDRRQLHASDEQRRKLLANISHELATPLTSIRGFAETLLDPSIAVSDEERTDYLHRVLDEAQRLDLLTRDVLDLARLEAGSPLTLAALDFAELCRNTVERFGPAFATAGLRLEWLGPLERAPIVGDGRRLEQLLDNLLMNALRYVPRGGWVEVSLADAAGAEPGAFLLAVQDDGPGIPTADLPQIFERFYRADATRVVPGSGLGLAIVREIVQRHGGAVAALARVPHGARFEVRLPAATAPPNA